MAQTSILFVDDEEVIRTSFTRELQAEHFAVTAAADGSEAVAVLRAVQFDLVITDLMMPGVDGFTVCHLLKGDRATRDIRVEPVHIQTPVAPMTGLRMAQPRPGWPPARPLSGDMSGSERGSCPRPSL